MPRSRDWHHAQRVEALAGRAGADVTAPGGDAGVRAVCSATDGRGADVVIESTGHVQSLAHAIAMVRPGGTIVLFGIYRR